MKGPTAPSVQPEIVYKVNYTGVARKGRCTVETRAQGKSERRGVVITGGSKGLGFAMGREFLKTGDALVLCGRNEQRVEAAVDALRAEWPGSEVHGTRCDMSDPADVAALGQYTVDRLGTVHTFINNAGEVTTKRLLADVDAHEIVRVVGSNVAGSLLGCREAIRIMRQQAQQPQPVYHIFNLGFSRWGASFSKSACTHKATKSALTQLTQSLSEELQEAGLCSIGVHNLSPGMVLTDLLLKDASPIARRFFNALAEEPETVAEALVPQIRAMQGTNGSVDFLSPVTAVGRVLIGVPQIIGGGRFFDKEGNRVKAAEARYKGNGVRLQFNSVED
ncbi:g4784 [Coccomyxa elongata]